MRVRTRASSDCGSVGPGLVGREERGGARGAFASCIQPRYRNRTRRKRASATLIGPAGALTVHLCAGALGPRGCPSGRVPLRPRQLVPPGSLGRRHVRDQLLVDTVRPRHAQRRRRARLAVHAGPGRVQPGGAAAVPACTVPAGAGCPGHGRRHAGVLPGRGTLTKKSGNFFRVGIFLDFVWLTTRTPHGAYVRRARRNRIDHHGGEIERLALQDTLEPVLDGDARGFGILDLDGDGVLTMGEVGSTPISDLHRAFPDFDFGALCVAKGKGGQKASFFGSQTKGRLPAFVSFAAPTHLGPAWGVSAAKQTGSTQRATHQHRPARPLPLPLLAPGTSNAAATWAGSGPTVASSTSPTSPAPRASVASRVTSRAARSRRAAHAKNYEPALRGRALSALWRRLSITHSISQERPQHDTHLKCFVLRQHTTLHRHCGHLHTRHHHARTRGRTMCSFDGGPGHECLLGILASISALCY